MPEGPEIRRISDKLSKILVHKKLVWYSFPYLEKNYKNINDFNYIKNITSRGKSILIRLDNDYTIYSHCQLYGKWTINLTKTKLNTNRSLRLEFITNNHHIRLWSATDINLIRTTDENNHPFLKKLGIDILDSKTDYNIIFKTLISKKCYKRKAATIMLDQSSFGGLGNYLRSEILYNAKIHPENRPCDLSNEALMKWAESIKDITYLSYKTGGLTISKIQYKKNKESGENIYGLKHAVFCRYNYKCHICNEIIKRKWYAKRKLDYCSNCQNIK